MQLHEEYRPRCWDDVVGQEKVHVMSYDPRVPFHERYVKNPPPMEPAFEARIIRDALALCDGLGYDMNTVEFAVRDGIPYAIDFCNPAPDADVHSIGEDNFEWVVETAANMAIRHAREHVAGKPNLSWGNFVAATAADAQNGNFRSGCS